MKLLRDALEGMVLELLERPEVFRPDVLGVALDIAYDMNDAYLAECLSWMIATRRQPFFSEGNLVWFNQAKWGNQNDGDELPEEVFKHLTGEFSAPNTHCRYPDKQQAYFELFAAYRRARERGWINEM